MSPFFTIEDICIGYIRNWPLEMSEYFALLSHRIGSGVPREVVDERDIISASAVCGYLGRSPYI